MALYNANLADGGNSEDDLQEIKDTLGYTAGKNLLENTGTTTTKNGITFTVNNDGSVTVNGTATGLVSFNINDKFSLPNGEYILSGCPEGGDSSTYYLFMLASDGLAPSDKGDGKTFVVNNNHISYVAIFIQSGVTLNNLTFYPMIRKASVTDDTYEPYNGIDVDTRFEIVSSSMPKIFIDTSNVIYTFPAVSTNSPWEYKGTRAILGTTVKYQYEISWVATEDCILCGGVAFPSSYREGTIGVYVNDIMVGGSSGEGGGNSSNGYDCAQSGVSVFVKKGQTVTLAYRENATHDLKAYGLMS